MKIVETGVKLIRNGVKYGVVIADDNIFVICEYTSETVVNYDHPEIYSNQSEINTLSELHFKKQEVQE